MNWDKTKDKNMSNKKYTIGIDLGTTNCVIAYSLLEAEGDDAPEIRLLAVPQLVANGTVEARESLPSFLYLGTENERQAGGLALPWEAEQSFAVGEMARRSSAESPDRTVGAAKSWLCHHGVDRNAPILPWGASADVPKISPVEASQRYLEHLVAAWESEFPDTPIAEQEVVLTVPASFDAGARELTREAALAAGLPGDLILLEEPQAAVYCWLESQGEQWRKDLTTDDTLLVCDIGGGTTDLTLVSVSEEDGELVLERRAVGNHLLIGGDNMDLAMAYHVSSQLAEQGTKLDPWQSVSLWHSCRNAKEMLFTPDGPATQTISVLGRGSRLIGGTVSTEIERDAIARMLVDGFFPECTTSDRPESQPSSGFQEMGLPFESDSRITHHLAAFLALHKDEAAPTRVLFNGGVFKAEVLRQRLLEVLGSWFDGGVQPLHGTHDLDNAAARGAAYYGWAKRSGGIRIRGGTAFSYYVGIETSGPAIPGVPRPLRGLCVVPAGMEEGTEADVPSSPIGLVVGQPAQFRFFQSATRKDDNPGDLIDNPERQPDETMTEVDPLVATLSTEEPIEERYVPVTFQSRITELGMFELWCVGTQVDRKWKLEFNVRSDA